MTKIIILDKRFDAMKKHIRECLEKCMISVARVANALMSLSADDVDEHKQFLESHVSAIIRAANHSELFGAMNFNWNYLSYHLLDHLVQEFQLEGVKGEMEAYKKDLRQFREKTPLTLFCQTQKRGHVLRLYPGFQEMVAKFDWPAETTLEVVEHFRQEYAYNYSLRKYAMMLAEVHSGSFVVTWFIPESIVEKLTAKVPRAIFKKYFVTELKITGRCVYRLRKYQVSKSCFLVVSYKQRLSSLHRHTLKLLRSAVIPSLEHWLQQIDLSMLIYNYFGILLY